MNLRPPGPEPVFVFWQKGLWGRGFGITSDTKPTKENGERLCAIDIIIGQNRSGSSGERFSWGNNYLNPHLLGSLDKNLNRRSSNVYLVSRRRDYASLANSATYKAIEYSSFERIISLGGRLLAETEDLKSKHRACGAVAVFLAKESTVRQPRPHRAAVFFIRSGRFSAFVKAVIKSSFLSARTK